MWHFFIVSIMQDLPTNMSAYEKLMKILTCVFSDYVDICERKTECKQTMVYLFPFFAFSGCPAGWVRHGKSCYYIDDTPTQAWSAARAACKGLGADLPIIRSAEENKFIGDLVFKQATLTWGCAWIGIQRNQADDKLYWIDGTLVAGGYTTWSRGNPSNSGGNEDCGHIMGKAGPGWEHQEKMWNDVPCALTASWFGNKYPVILCEKSLI